MGMSTVKFVQHISAGCSLCVPDSYQAKKSSVVRTNIKICLQECQESEGYTLPGVCTNFPKISYIKVDNKLLCG